jgi:hypothetical protein
MFSKKLCYKLCKRNLKRVAGRKISKTGGAGFRDAMSLVGPSRRPSRLEEGDPQRPHFEDAVLHCASGGRALSTDALRRCRSTATLKYDMRYLQSFPPSISPTPRQCNRAIPYQIRRYSVARNPFRGRPSISVRRQTGNRNESPLSGRLTLPGNGKDGRGADIRSSRRISESLVSIGPTALLKKVTRTRLGR